MFGGLDFSRRDLMAVNIQRGRDHGLPDYNTARREFELPEIKAWDEINPSKCGPGKLETSDECQVGIQRSSRKDNWLSVLFSH